MSEPFRQRKEGVSRQTQETINNTINNKLYAIIKQPKTNGKVNVVNVTKCRLGRKRIRLSVVQRGQPLHFFITAFLVYSVIQHQFTKTTLSYFSATPSIYFVLGLVANQFCVVLQLYPVIQHEFTSICVCTFQLISS